MTISPLPYNPSEADWWRQALVYQIYPRSFCDANGDGIGDLEGIISKVPYLQQLGVDAVWLSPFYPSGLKDGGYDVADFRDVDPRIGTLDQFDTMVAAFKAASIKVIVDIVPNHSSNEHIWFQAALKAPIGSPERARYIFRDGKGPNKELPPSDWLCKFGGPSWTAVGDGQWYLHMFDSSQPDFNWDNREVRDDFLHTLKFWADRGVSGFRVDVAKACVKDMSEPLCSQAHLDHLMAKMAKEELEEDEHPLLDRNAVFEIYREWRKLFNTYSPPLTGVAEAWIMAKRQHLYAKPDGLGQAFNFDLLLATYDAASFRSTIERGLSIAAESGSSTTWVFSNHDVIRHATRYGLPATHMESRGKKYTLGRGKDPVSDRELGLKRACAATLMILGLPGSTYIYQGEELGLFENVEMSDSERQDPIYFRSPGVDLGRDGCRTCLPWVGSAKNMGFGDGARPHLPQPEGYEKLAADVEDKDPKSTLNFYRAALAERKVLQTAEELEWVGAKDSETVHYKRPNGWEVLVNFGAEPVPVPAGHKVVVSSGELVDGAVGQDTAVWLMPA